MALINAKGNLGYLYNFHPTADDPTKYTVLILHGSTAVGIWECGRLGTSRGAIEAMTDDDFDSFCTCVVLQLMGGDLTCP
jgi:hypothetical protein